MSVVHKHVFMPRPHGVLSFSTVCRHELVMLNSSQHIPGGTLTISEKNICDDHGVLNILPDVHGLSSTAGGLATR